MFNKKGVSLITVLMLMLVATIAATATFKWLSSENRSSASRMEMQESRQSAIAGIQATRAWIANNANDVGAVVRQFYLGGGPISLNSRVVARMNDKQDFNVWLTDVSEESGVFKFKILSEGNSLHSSKHSEVAILNVTGLYQVTPPVEPEVVKSLDFTYTYFGGSVRNHGDVQISSMLINGNWYGNPVSVDKNIIITGNANLTGNNIDILGTGCIGGNLYAKNGIDAKNLYVHGKTSEFGTKKTSGHYGIYGHAYFDGVVEQDHNMQIRIAGNLTVKNQFKTDMKNAPVTVEGNLCLDSTASQIQIGGMHNGAVSKDFQVNGDVWADDIATHSLRGYQAFYAPGGDFSDRYNRLILGNDEESKIYVRDVHHSNEYKTMRDNKSFMDAWSGEGPAAQPYKPYVSVAASPRKYCFYDADEINSNNDVDYNGSNYLVGGYAHPHSYRWGDGFPTKLSPYSRNDESALGNSDRPVLHVTPWFTSKAKYPDNFMTPSLADRPVECADSVYHVCYDIWEKKPGCDNSEYKVDDILKTAYNEFERYADSGCAANITELNNSFPADLNACYKSTIEDNTKKKNHLYNGYLVVKVESKELCQDFTEDLDGGDNGGKFIIILTNSPSHSVVLPATKSRKDFVFLYLSQGGFQLQSVNKEGVFKSYNYFIYTVGNVGTSETNIYTGVIEPKGGFLFNTDTLRGTVYAAIDVPTVNACNKVASLTTNKPMVFNQELLDDLNKNKVICPTSIANCGGVAVSSSSTAGSSSSISSSDLINDKDPYFISVAPQLSVTLESQYKTMEPVSNPDNEVNITPSILVLPRIIYLSKDPEGKLADYYSVLKLNGATEVKNASRVTCRGPGSIPTTGALYDGNEEHLLVPGPYTCSYNSENDGTNPFYIVVNNTIGEVPLVKFVPPALQALNLNDAATVSVHVGKSSRNFKFYVTIEGSYTGWTITPKAGVAEYSSVGNKRYYSVEVTANSSERNVELFTISTNESSEDGDMYISLTPPTENCLLSSNVDESIHHVYVKARTTINRGTIEDYCYKNPSDATVCNDDMLERPNCENYDNEWVTATGTGCRVLGTNDTWKCLTNSPISLASVYANEIPPECEIVIPSSDMNRLSNPVAGESEYLYASLKRKKVELTVKTLYAQDRNTYVNVREPEFSLNESCTHGDGECTYRVYAGTPIVISHEEIGDDKDHFGYWSCEGNECPDSHITGDELEFSLSGSHTVTAVYNKEYLCYYEDFTKTMAFCGIDGEDCVDTCAVVLEGDEACKPRNGKQPKSKWLMTYHNKGTGENSSYARPTFGTSGSIYASNTQDKPSVILRNKKVGLSGTMNALVQTGIVDNANTSDFLNSGLIFRSNGSEHLVLNIYGTNKPGNSGELKFRVCKVEGQSIKNTTEGNCKVITAKDGAPLSINSKTFIKVRLIIDENDLLKVTAQIDVGQEKETWNGEINIGDFMCNTNMHVYNGFSLADAEFRIYENLWISSELDEACSEIPSIKCQFKENPVSVDTDVLPDVSIVNGSSDWFTGKNCAMDFYYNGCDNTTTDNSGYCANSKDLGQLGELGSKINGESFHFTETGPHGNSYDNKKRWEASVKVVCPGDQTSLDIAQDYYSCNYFNVGEIVNCSKDVEVYNNSQYLTANMTEEFPIPNGKANMRNAVLKFHIDVDDKKPEKNLGTDLKVQMQSTNGMKSPVKTINKTGAIDIPVTDGISGFNPEEVSKILITSEDNISISKLHIHSHCADKLDLKCADEATYDYSKGWEIKMNPQPPEVKCSYKSTDSNIEPENDVSCSETMYLTYKQNHGFYWYDMNSATPSFVVTIKAKNASDSCIIQGTRPGSNTQCSVNETTIPYGSSAPTFSYKFGQSMVGFNNFKVNYRVVMSTLTATDSVVKEGQIQMGELGTYRYPNDDLSGGNYEYKVIFSIGDWSHTPCSSKFTVQDKEKIQPTLDCEKSYVSNGKYTAVVNNPDDISYTCMFSTDVIVDELGHTKTVDGNSVSGSGSDPIYYTYVPGKAGTYYYTAQIGDSKCVYSEVAESPIELQCPSIIHDQNPNESIVVNPTVGNCDGCTYKIFNEDLEVSTDLVFYDLNGSGTKQYRLQVQDKNENVATCNFTVAFKSQQNADVAELPYNGDYITFDVGTHIVKCNNGSGQLVCECPVLHHEYNECVVRVNGSDKTFMYNTSVDGDPKCGNIDQLSIEVLPPITGNGKKTQPSGVKCKHAW